MQGMKRQYQQLISEYLSYFPCVVLVGARQTGKSTLINTMAEGRALFDLEASADYDQIARDPGLFLRIHDGPMAIDEAQLMPDLFPALRVAIDKDRKAYGKYLLSGSSSPELLSAISESLAGRVGIIEIAPFSFSETQLIDRPPLLTLFDVDRQPDAIIKTVKDLSAPVEYQAVHHYWMHGGYPEPWIRNKDRFREVWSEQYVKTYIERDIARLFPNLNATRFRHFIELLASCSGDIINYSKIAGVLDVSQPTIKDYFRIAHGTFLWRTLPAFSKNTKKRVVKHPRGYLRDSGLMHHLLQIPSGKRLIAHPQMGASWEGMVIEEVLRTLNAAGITYKAYYYRTSGGAEVDLVVEGKFGLIPFEIKHTQQVNSRQLRSLKDFVTEFNCPFGVVINNDEKVRQYDERIIGIPFAVLAAGKL